MRFVGRLLVMTSLATIFGSASLLAESGIVLEKPYPWSPATDLISVKEFSNLATRDNYESGYGEYFIGSDGKRFAIDRNKIVKVIFAVDVRNYTNIVDEAQLSPILADVSELKNLAAKYQLAKPYLDRQIAKLQGEISLFRRGARKVNGTWHSAEETARKRQEAADAEARRRQEAADAEAKLQTRREAEKESKTHLERAQSLSASGKTGDAIQELQEAYRIFPDPKVAETIRKLREDSLGL
jgi:tetratricopeptide (TPR) repeat protein